jgi:hypothetical protein
MQLVIMKRRKCLKLQEKRSLFWIKLSKVVADVSGNQSQQTRNVTKNGLETFAYDNNWNLTNWVTGNQNSYI